VLKELARRPLSKAELSKALGQRKVSGQLNKVVRLLLGNGMIEYTIPGKPHSRLQQYELTEKGGAALTDLTSGGRTE